ncbi:Ig-like domain-containing protein [Myxococcus sp. Y35]|uniref:Ig-like domain-containing protein n=1 Tax=Pseudomyxococcus flavus TaxID=3115648 RepID=UPI003CF09098
MRTVTTATLLATCALLSLAGCDNDDPTPPSPTPDAGTQPDAGTEPDAGTQPDAGSVQGPIVTGSTPGEGEQDVVPVEMFVADTATMAVRKRVSLTFDTPMDTTASQVTLIDQTTPANAPRALTGTWSEDGLTLSVDIPRPEADLPPLEEETRYTLDLEGLRSSEGRPVDATHAGLGDGRLDFTTGRRDAAMEHACGHSLLESPRPVTASASPTIYPATDAPHAFYALTLPASGSSFLGYTEVVSGEGRDEPVVLYLNHAVPVAVHDMTEGEDAIASALEPARPVCLPAITHTLKFTAPGGDRFLRLTFGPTQQETFNFVFERY